MCITMDRCCSDIFIEFLNVAFHNILYHCKVYPSSIFEARQKYGILVFRSINTEVNDYIEQCLKHIYETVSNGALYRVDFIITDSEYNPITSFVFGVEKQDSNSKQLPSLEESEQNLRAFCLNLAVNSGKFIIKNENPSFEILLHTNQTAAIAMAHNPELEDFPFIEVQNSQEIKDPHLFPLRNISIKNHDIECYVEL